MYAADSERVDIGVLDKTEPWKLKPNFFPSKVGGKPAWLDLEHFPKSSDCMCPMCSTPLTFLCQVYAPVEDEPDAFHRVLFVFICKNSTCYKTNQCENMKILRCQIKRDNAYYSFEPPLEDEADDFDTSKWPTACRICGLKAPSHCSKCKKVNYCHRAHQIFDWKNGHKSECVKWSTEKDNVTISEKNENEILFPEWEIVMEEEYESSKSKHVSAKREMGKLQKLLKEKRAGCFHDITESEIEPYSNSTEDRIFSKFTKAVAQYPDQILRYSRGSKPLWIAGNPDPPNPNIPDCEYCGSKRQYEFQIMPQLLNFLDIKHGVNDIDWGILVAYTCTKSCSMGPSYKTEYLFKQDVV